MRMKTLNRICAGFVAAVLATVLCLPVLSAAADDTVISIGNEKQLESFAKKCKSNAWSRGKSVNLTADIDISNTDFLPIPIFGGSFNGNGHTISGMNIEKKGSSLALFRYLEEGGIIENLCVSGKVDPDGSRRNIGGIVGENSGRIENCKFSGNISGDAYVGGICGSVTESGCVSDCEFEGTVIGKSYTGGIAGQSLGTLERCTNIGSVNTKDTEEKKTIQDIDIDISNLRTTENIDAATDSGGICGYSKGKIIGCTNYGDVGYKSVGYNTGGICGRQAGYISDCTNFGEINGRKDIGGICGQAEPYIMLEYTEDALKKLDGVFDRIRAITDDNILKSDGDFWDSLDRLDTAADLITDTTRVLSDNAEIYADGISDSVNDASERLHKALDDSGEALDAMTAAADRISEGAECLRVSCEYLKEAIDTIESAGSNLDGALSMLQKSAKRLSGAFDELEEFTESLEEGSTELVGALKDLSAALGKGQNVESSFKAVFGSLSEVCEALCGISDAAEEISDAAEILDSEGCSEGADLRGMSESLENLAKNLKTIAKAFLRVGDACLNLADSFDVYSLKSAISLFSKGMDYLSKAMSSMRWMLDDLRSPSDGSDGLAESMRKATEKMGDGLKKFEEGADEISFAVNRFSEIAEEMGRDGVIKMPVASEVFGDSFDSFFDAVKGVSDELSDLKRILKGKKNKFSDDIDDLNAELEKMSDILSDVYDEQVKADENGFVEDISDSGYLSDTRGRIEESVNSGAVFGDINVGGICGAMAIEYDFDPEDDVKNSGEKSLKLTYKTKCTIRRCKNDAEVISKRDCCGGIVGKMDIGSVMTCENYGDIKSEDGNYTGGIVGYSDTVVRNSVSKCSLSGVDYIGGIAGFGTNVSGCGAIVSVLEYGECAGSVAGYCEHDESKRNIFVGDELGGIDDVSYEGIAENTSVDDFVRLVNSSFDTEVSFTLVFVCDDKEIARVPFVYGKAIAAEEIPKVPEKKGYYGKWNEYDFDNPKYDATISAEYYREVELIETARKRESGKAVVLVCGAFSDEAAVKAKEEREIPENLKRKRVYDGCSVKISGVYNEKYTVRYLPLKNEKCDIYVKYDGKAEKVGVKQVGSYLEFETRDNNFVIYEVNRSHTVPVIIGIATFFALTAAIVFVIRKKRTAKA